MTKITHDLRIQASGDRTMSVLAHRKPALQRRSRVLAQRPVPSQFPKAFQ